MKIMRIALIGIATLAAPFIATNAFANQATFNTFSPGSGNIRANGDTAGNFASAHWTASQQSGYAYTNNTVYSSKGSYGGSAQIRCNGSNQIVTTIFYSPTTNGTAVCVTTANVWAGTLFSN